MGKNVNHFVVPAKAGTQYFIVPSTGSSVNFLDSRFRGNDGKREELGWNGVKIDGGSEQLLTKRLRYSVC